MTSSRSIIEPVKKRIPVHLKMKLRLYQYNLQLIKNIVAGSSQRNPIHWLRTYQNRKRVLFYPDFPWRTSAMYQMCLLLGCRVSMDPAMDFDIAIKWKDATHYKPDRALKRLAESHDVINANCNDISKKHVEAVFQEVFGYGSFIDPRTYIGKCVQKSDLNAKHDGKIVECPIDEPEEGSVYQILVDTRINENCVKDLRLPIFKDTLPYVMVWIKPVNARFSEIDDSEIATVSAYFTREEQNNILQFCKKMGLDYGELDILRDKTDGRLYIIDVNNTPDGPSLDEAGAIESIKARAVVFDYAFLRTNDLPVQLEVAMPHFP